MNAGAALLARLRGQGVTVRAAGDALCYHPADALTPALVAELRAHKRAILALLAADEPAVAARVAAMRARHPRPWPAIPFLTVRDVPRTAPGCRSCGEPVTPLGAGPAVRCRPCALAAWLVTNDAHDGKE